LAIGAAVPIAATAQQPANGTSTLIDLYRIALHTHPAMVGQRAGVERAQARRDQLASRLGLQVAASLNFARNDFRGQAAPPDEYDSRRHSLNLRVPIIDVSTRRQVGSENERIEQSRYELEATRAELASELVELTLDVLNADEELAVLVAEQESVGSQRERLRRMVERQMAKVPELLEVEAYQVTLQAREIEVRNALRIAREKLRLVVGDEIGALRGVATDRLPPLEDSAAAWVDRAFAQSPRISALRRSVEAEQRAISSARAQAYPVVSATASKTWADSDSDSRRNPPFNIASVGVLVSVPLYEGGRVDATVREASARYSQAQAQLDEGRRDVEREVRTAWLKAQGDQQRIAATLQAAQAQDKAREAQQRGFELGAVTVVDLLETQRRLYRARADHARARHDYLRALATLRRHAGALAETDMEIFSAVFSGPAREPR
jgi:outer membrane protein